MRGSMTAILVLLLLVAAALVAGCGNGSDAGGKAVKDVKGPALLFFTMDA